MGGCSFCILNIAYPAAGCKRALKWLLFWTKLSETTEMVLEQNQCAGSVLFFRFLPNLGKNVRLFFRVTLHCFVNCPGDKMIHTFPLLFCMSFNNRLLPFRYANADIFNGFFEVLSAAFFEHQCNAFSFLLALMCHLPITKFFSGFFSTLQEYCSRSKYMCP